MMMRSVRVLTVMVAFGAGSAMARECFVKGGKGCAGGVVVKVDGMDMCKVGRAKPELAFFPTKQDCAIGENGNVASADANSGRIPGQGKASAGESQGKKASKSRCYFMEPQSNGQETCSEGEVVSVKSLYNDFEIDTNPAGGEPGICSVAGWVVSRFHLDSGCKDLEGLPSVCWIQKSGSTDCDSLRPGTLVNTDNGIDLCKVGSSSGEMDFFFDNHCEHGNLAWNSKKSGKIADEKKADQNGIKPIVQDAITMDDVDHGTGGPVPKKPVKTTKPVRTKSSKDASGHANKAN